MIEILNKMKCTGCGACLNVCPTNAISMITDEEGFRYPLVDKAKCINCHLCERTCPLLEEGLNTPANSIDPGFFAAQHKNKELLKKVSSGGAAWALAEYVLSCSGVVYGAIQENVDNVFHYRFENIDDAEAIRRSKYFQSNTLLCFREAKRDLEEHKLVLFTGVGCQIAGLKSFLGKEYDNLITADVVCHGVPSSLVWKKYKSEAEQTQKSKMIGLVFRDKSRGWKLNQYKTTYSNGTNTFETSSSHPFHRGYLMGLFNRPSCGCCRFSKLPRQSDFTFADYWLYDGVAFENTIDLGISLVAVNTLKAQSVFKNLGELITAEETTAEKALNSCRHMNNAPLASEKRSEFFAFIRNHSYKRAWAKYIKEKKSTFLKRLAKTIVRRG